MKKYTILLFALVIANFLAAQKSYDLPEFNSIAITNSADVVLSQGRQSVSVSGPQELIDRLELEVKKQSLTIKNKKGNWKNNTKGKLKIAISIPTIKALLISGSGNLDINGNFDVGTLAVTISGSGDIACNGSISADKFALVISGSGDAQFNGSAESQSITLSGSGDLDNSNFKTKVANVVNSGSADVAIYASQNVSIVNSGSGDINVGGSPEKKAIVNTGSGDIDYK